MTPVGYAAVGTGIVALLSLIIFVYKKVRKISSASSGGSYSPTSPHRGKSGKRKGSSKSENSEGGQSLVSELSTNEDIIKTTHAIVEETKPHALQSDGSKVKNTIQKSSAPGESLALTELGETSKTQENSLQNSDSSGTKSADCVEIISETQSRIPTMEKPARRNRINDKFTTDKTSASNLNEDSLICVSQAIGGLLKDQIPEIIEKDNTSMREKGDSPEPNGDSTEIISLIGRTTSKPIDTKGYCKIDSGTDSDTGTDSSSKTKIECETPVRSSMQSADVNVQNITDGQIEEAVPKTKSTILGGDTEGNAFYCSLEIEPDGGSEYFSADDASEATKDLNCKMEASSGESTPTQDSFHSSNDMGRNFEKPGVRKEEFQTNNEFVRTPEAVQFDGDDTIRERHLPLAVNKNLSKERADMTNYRNENVKDGTSHRNLYGNINEYSQGLSNDSFQPSAPSEFEDDDLHQQNVIQPEENLAQHAAQPAESIVRDIINSSNLDAVTTQLIQKDLGASEFSCGATERTTNTLPTAMSPGNSELNSQEKQKGLHGGEFSSGERASCSGKLTPNKLYENVQRNNIRNSTTSSTQYYEDKEDSHTGIDSAVSSSIGVIDGSSNAVPTRIDQGTLKSYTQDIFGAECICPNDDPKINANKMEHGENLINLDLNLKDFIIPKEQSKSWAISDSEGVCRIASQETTQELGAGTSTKTDLSSSPSNLKANLAEGYQKSSNKTTWYIPASESFDQPEATPTGLYIALNEEIKKSLEERSACSETQHVNEVQANQQLDSKVRAYSPNKSWAYLDINQDADNINEVWPYHLPKNIHVNNTSGTGWIEASEGGRNVQDILKANESDSNVNDQWPYHLPKNIHANNTSGTGLVKATEGGRNVQALLRGNETEINVNEVWPCHLPRNIHVNNISGTGLIKASEGGRNVHSILKQNETETIEESKSEESEQHRIIPKNIPEFKLPNMDRRLLKKRNLKRRQIKSLDSGVLHYYGEYMDLVPFPEIDEVAEGSESKVINKNGKNERVDQENSRKSGNTEEEEIEEVVTFEPDGTIKEEKILIQQSRK